MTSTTASNSKLKLNLYSTTNRYSFAHFQCFHAIGHMTGTASWLFASKTRSSKNSHKFTFEGLGLMWENLRQNCPLNEYWKVTVVVGWSTDRRTDEATNPSIKWKNGMPVCVLRVIFTAIYLHTASFFWADSVHTSDLSSADAQSAWSRVVWSELTESKNSPLKPQTMSCTGPKWPALVTSDCHEFTV